MIARCVVNAQAQGNCLHWHVDFLVYADSSADYILVVCLLQIARPHRGHTTELPAIFIEGCNHEVQRAVIDIVLHGEETQVAKRIWRDRPNRIRRTTFSATQLCNLSLPQASGWVRVATCSLLVKD
jgi:hypothetical protein